MDDSKLIKKTFASKLLLRLAPIVRWIDKTFTVPYSMKKVTGKFYFEYRDLFDEGTVFLTQALGHGSNLINPSELNHAGIYFGRGLLTHINNLIESLENKELVARLVKIRDTYKVNDDIRYVLEATGYGVIPTDLVSFLTSKDVVVAKQANFCSKKIALDASRKAVYALGKPYDYSFSHAEDTKYCFEVCADAFEEVSDKKLKRAEYKIFGIKVHEVFLSDTFTTSDWETLVDSREVIKKK